ncbi:MAG: ATP-binding protein, partial [Lautropia sp.]
RERLAACGLQIGCLRSSEPLPIVGDPDRLQQVFQNLLENAARYVEPAPLRVGSVAATHGAARAAPLGSRPGDIEAVAAGIHVDCRSDGDAVRIDFDDTGPGVPDAELGRLFDRFYRREASRNRATGGSGLGLAICRSIVDAHDGEIEAARSPFGGLRIRIRLPLSGNPPVAGSPAAGAR